MSDFPTRQEIEIRAYEIYLTRGAEDGHDLEDWLQAEEELLLASATPANVRASAAAAGSQGVSAPRAAATATRESR